MHFSTPRQWNKSTVVSKREIDQKDEIVRTADNKSHLGIQFGGPRRSQEVPAGMAACYDGKKIVVDIG